MRAKSAVKGIPVFRPAFGEEELQALREVFASHWLGQGPKSAQFEERFAHYVGAEYAVSANSGTAALHLACAALGIGAGDEVLVPSLTFVSTAHAPALCGADVVFVDVDPATRTLDPQDLRSRITPRSKAVIPVHYGGHPCDMDAVWEVADEHGLAVIEDAAHACSAAYKGRRVGGLARSQATCFSFNALKNLSTGDGGMVTTNSAQLAERVRQLRWLGIGKSTYERSVEDGEGQSPDSSGYEWFYEVRHLSPKYIMNDIDACLGLVQLEKLESGQARRRLLAQRYARAFEELEWMELPREQEWARSAWHLYAVRLEPREELRNHLSGESIATSVHYTPIHLQNFYRGKLAAALPHTERLGRELLTLPFHPALSDEEIGRVIDSVLRFSAARQPRGSATRAPA